jgi:hypothetical protein
MESNHEEKIILIREDTHCKSTYRYRRGTEKERQENRVRLAKEIAKIVLDI